MSVTKLVSAYKKPLMASAFEEQGQSPGLANRGRAVATATKPRPRLLIVGPRATNIGGVEIVTEAVLASDAFSDFQVFHFDSTKGRPKHTQGKVDLGNTIWGFRFLARMIRDMYRHKPDVVYMPLVGRWAPFMRDCTLAFIARAMGARVVGHVHGGSIIGTVRTRGWRRYLVRSGLSNFHTLLPLGATVKRVLEEEGFRGELISVPSTMSKGFFERGIDFARNETNGPVRGLFVGQVGDNKGIPELLQAMAIAKRRGQRSTIRVVGPEELTGDMERLLRMRHQLGVEDVVQFSGPLRGEDLDNAYRESDFLILPSHKEMLPIVILEAGVYGMPVITTPVGAIPDLVEHGKNGLFVPPGDVAAIVDAVELMERAPLRQALGTRLREDVQRFHPDSVCSRIAAAVKCTTITRSQRNNRLMAFLRNVAWPPVIVAVDFVYRSNPFS